MLIPTGGLSYGFSPEIPLFMRFAIAAAVYIGARMDSSNLQAVAVVSGGEAVVAIADVVSATVDAAR